VNETRRRFSDEEKLKILAEADEVRKKGGSLPALAEKYKLYTSAIYEWRKLVAKGRLKPATNGVKETSIAEFLSPATPAATSDSESASPKERILTLRVADLERALAYAERRAERAESLLALHKEVARLEAEMASEPKEA
jgi:transposase-like protein